jgi:hypothetical protein
MPIELQDALDFAREGFSQVNAIQGLVVAFVAAFLMREWGRWLIVTIGAVIAHIALDVLAPMIANDAAFRLPPVLESHYWRYLGLLAVGYFIVIGLLFAVRRVITNR